MSPKDKAATAAIIGNALTFQVIQKVKAVLFPPPSFLLAHQMKIKHCKVSILFFCTDCGLERRAGFEVGVYLMSLPVLVVQVGKNLELTFLMCH